MSSRAASFSFMSLFYRDAHAFIPHSGGLEVQQRRLGPRPADILTRRPVGPHDPVAGDHDRQRIVGAGGAGGPAGGGVAPDSGLWAQAAPAARAARGCPIAAATAA